MVGKIVEGRSGFQPGFGMRRLLVLPLLVLGLAFVECATSQGSPEMPRVSIEIAETLPSRKAIAIPAGGDFQSALDKARPGDTITLEAGATFSGPFVLPNKGGEGWITIRTSADTRLPPPGTRVSPSHADAMPKLVAESDAVIAAAEGAHHYRFVGIEFRPKRGSFLHNLVLLGSKETSLERVPHHFVFDRCYFHGDPGKGSRRGIALNSRNTAIVNSYFADFKEIGADSQAIGGWNGPGPFKIANNYLEGAGENIMFGGFDPSIPDLVPSDIEIQRNHFMKPLSWKIGEPTYGGTPWQVKNLFELKNARRVLVEGNTFQHNWAHAQNGFAILFTVRTERDRAKWAVVEDVTFVNNVLCHSANGINILGLDDTSPTRSGRTRRIHIKNNLFIDIGGGRWGGMGRLFQLLEGAQDIWIENNSASHTGNTITAEGSAHRGFVYRNNIAQHNAYGIFGSGTGAGNAAIKTYFPDGVFEKNVLAGGDASQYPSGNFFPSSLEAVGFSSPRSGNYTLSDRSPYRQAGTDGRDVGVDLASLVMAMGAAGNGKSSAAKASKVCPTPSQ